MKSEPNNADSLAELAYMLAFAGEPEEAEAFVRKAKLLNPSFPPWYHRPAGIVLYLQGDYEQAIREFTSWFESEPLPIRSALWLAAAQARVRRTTEAEKTLGEMTHREKFGLNLFSIRYLFPFKHQEDLDRVLEGLRRAGVPEAAQRKAADGRAPN